MKSLTAFVGPKGVGKSTLATAITKNHGWMRRMSFARPIRKMLEGIGVTEYYHTWYKNKPIPTIPGNPTARMLMQTLGTEWGRDTVHPNIWVNAAIIDIKEAMKEKDVYVDDCRFPNEAKAVLDAGGVIIRILPNPEWDVQDDVHESERYWREMPASHELVNDGTEADLLQKWKELNI
jgi:hypothetical protein